VRLLPIPIVRQPRRSDGSWGLACGGVAVSDMRAGAVNTARNRVVVGIVRCSLQPLHQLGSSERMAGDATPASLGLASKAALRATAGVSRPPRVPALCRGLHSRETVGIVGGIVVPEIVWLRGAAGPYGRLP